MEADVLAAGGVTENVPVRSTAEMLGSRESFDRLRDFIRAACEYGDQALAAVVPSNMDELQAGDVELTFHYSRSISKLKEVYENIFEYIDVLENHPSCNEERRKAILAELGRDRDAEAKLDIEKEERFPRTLQFIEELRRWINGLMVKLDEIKALFDSFDTDIRATLERVERAQLEGMWQFSTGTTAASAAAASVAATSMAAGSLLGGVISGGLFLPFLGVTTGISVLAASGGYRQHQRDLSEAKSKLEKLRQDTRELEHATSAVVRKRRGFELRDNSRCPLIRELEKSFEALFEFLKEKINFDEGRERARLRIFPT